MKIIVQDNPAPGVVAAIADGLIEHARGAGIEPRNYAELGVILCDENATTVGGVVGATVWGWLHIREFWVAESRRGVGWGSRLLERAELEAVRRRCHHAYLDTFDFQALGFYRRHGYTVFGSLRDFPRGHVRYFVQKQLSPV
jgi:ribosomal protein S18 acetylase RimI-like enzyme